VPASFQLEGGSVVSVAAAAKQALGQRIHHELRFVANLHLVAFYDSKHVRPTYMHKPVTDDFVLQKFGLLLGSCMRIVVSLALLGGDFLA
jgi:hypothetical protein